MKNHCFRKTNFLDSHEDLQFLLEKRLLSESEKEIAQNIENLVKADGFQANGDMETYSNVTVRCLGNNEWKFHDKERYQ